VEGGGGDSNLKKKNKKAEGEVVKMVESKKGETPGAPVGLLAWSAVGLRKKKIRF